MEIITSLNFSELRQLIVDSIQSAMQGTPQQSPILSDRIDLNEACKITGLKKSTLYRATHDNTIPFKKFGGKRLVFSRKDLLAWIDSKTIGTQEASDTLTKAAIKRLR